MGSVISAWESYRAWSSFNVLKEKAKRFPVSYVSGNLLALLESLKEAVQQILPSMDQTKFEQCKSYWSVFLGVFMVFGWRLILWWEYAVLDFLVGMVLTYINFQGVNEDEAKVKKQPEYPIAEYAMYFCCTNTVDLIIRLLVAGFTLNCLPSSSVGEAILLSKPFLRIMSMGLESIHSWFGGLRLWAFMFTSTDHPQDFNIYEVVIEFALWEVVPANVFSMLFFVGGDLKEFKPDMEPLGLGGLVLLIAFLCVNFDTKESVLVAKIELYKKIESTLHESIDCFCNQITNTGRELANNRLLIEVCSEIDDTFYHISVIAKWLSYPLEFSRLVPTAEAADLYGVPDREIMRQQLNANAEKLKQLVGDVLNYHGALGVLDVLSSVKENNDDVVKLVKTVYWWTVAFMVVLFVFLFRTEDKAKDESLSVYIFAGYRACLCVHPLWFGPFVLFYLNKIFHMFGRGRKAVCIVAVHLCIMAIVYCLPISQYWFYFHNDLFTEITKKVLQLFGLSRRRGTLYSLRNIFIRQLLKVSFYFACSLVLAFAFIYSLPMIPGLNRLFPSSPTSQPLQLLQQWKKRNSQILFLASSCVLIAIAIWYSPHAQK